MPSINIEVDIDLDEFETDDLVQELKDRDEDIPLIYSKKIDTLEKQMKYDFFMENIERIPLDRLEKAIYEPFLNKNRSDSRVVRQRSAKALTAVQIRF